jgi:hypothetical protein
MGTERTRKEAIKLALYSIRSIYEAVRDGMFSSYYGKKLASRYWEKLNLSEKEIFRYFGENPNIETSVYKKRNSTLDWILGKNKEECLYALKYFGFIGKTGSPRSKPSKKGKW